MTKLIQLAKDTSGDWEAYTAPLALSATTADGTNFTQNGHREVWRFRAPAEWIANRQRAMMIGHACVITPNFQSRRPWHVRATGGLSVDKAGVCGCTHEMTPGSSFPGGANRNLAMNFMIDVRFISDFDTIVSVRMDKCGDYQLSNAYNTQSTLWVIPVDERDGQ
jgi:hypothetical protein